MAGRNRVPHEAFGHRRAYPVEEHIPRAPLARPIHPHPALLEEELEIRHVELHRLLGENRRLVEDRIGLEQELNSAREELRHLNLGIADMHAEQELQSRELFDRVLKLEADLRATEPLKIEAAKLRDEIKRLNAIRQDMTEKNMASLIIFILSILLITHSISSAATPPPDAGNLLRNDSDSIKKASNDYGNIVHEIPTGVLYPSTEKDIINLIKLSYNSKTKFTVAARGRGHSVRGQAMAGGGVVVDMTALGANRSRILIQGNSESGFYTDVGGEQLWIDVLTAAVAEGVAPVSWTDYVYLSVGGTLSNAGISGQSFLHGPQIANVLELDVITGRGEFMTCSRTRNPNLFYGVLGGLGQFGIITRARVILDKAPTRVKWAKLVYSDFSRFSGDQEYLISNNASNYVEGFLITKESDLNEWNSNFNSNSSSAVGLLKKQGILYAIELVKYYDNQTAAIIDQEFEALLNKLNYMPGYNVTRDVTFFDFIDRVGNLDSLTGPPQSHPWLNLFIPKSRIHDFNAGVLAGMLPQLNETAGLFIFYPFNKNKWDDRMSAVVPDEEVFYTLALLHTSPVDNYEPIDEFNNRVLEFCRSNGIEVKQYLPNIGSQQEWMKHFGLKWRSILQKKAMFDPENILSPGQRIFNYA